MLKTLLVCEHFEVTVASNGLEALEQLGQALPDLILLDLTMPLMDGPSFLRELEERGLRSTLRVVILTANIYSRFRAEDARVDGWVVKPFHLGELLREIRAVLGE